MRVILWLAMAAWLVACDSPSVALMGSQKTIIKIEGMTFNVHRRDDLVEVYRTGFVVLPDRARVLRLAELAIAQATGCSVRKSSLEGDQALIKARLSCDAASMSYTGPVRTFECRSSPAPGTDALDCNQV